MTTYGFSAFLKLLSMNPKPQRTQVRQRFTPSDGGYDFHRSLRLLARRLVAGEPLSVLLAEAASIKRPPERRSVEVGLTELALWLDDADGSRHLFEPALYVSPEKYFKVSFVPDLGITMDGRRVAIHLWNTARPPLSPRMAFAALALLPGLYGASETEPDDFAVLSLRDSHLYRLSEAPDHKLIAQRTIAELERTFGSVRDELVGPPTCSEDRLPS